MIFVTGGTGMVGAHLLYDLVLKGENVRALKRPGSSLNRIGKIFSFYNPDYRSLLQKIEWVEGDILDKDGLRELLIGVDQIYHTAAIISFDSRERDLVIQNNCDGTANLVDLALSLSIPRFCHVSSIAAIGTPPEGIEASEDHPWKNPGTDSAYAKSKYMAEMEVWRAILSGLNAVIVNPSVIIGPGDWRSGSSMIFSKIWQGLKFYTKGGTGFVDVRDVVRAMQQLMAENTWEVVKNQRYILNTENLTYRKFVDLICDSLRIARPKYLAGKGVLGVAWRASSLKRFLTGIPVAITRETAGSSRKLRFYDGTKICRTIGFQYTPVELTISEISRIFLNDMARNDKNI